MPRIPDDELERIKRETDLAQLVRARGVELTPHGKDLIGLCPFHDDHQPSLVLTPGKGLWHCLGACSAGGSVIDWVMKTEGVSFRHAVELLRAGVPSFAAASSGGLVKESSVRRLPPPVEAEASDAELLRQVVAYYHETLNASPEALAYLEKRGINNPDAIERFSLGYANRTLGLRLPLKNRKTGEAIRSRLQALGIIRESGHEHLVGCFTIPILSPAGEVLGIYGRRISDSVQAGVAPHLYLPGPHLGVWNLSALADSKEIILCESLIDALTFWCAGFHNVTTAYGVNGFTAEILEAFKAYGTERVLIAYDRDAAGDAAAEQLAAKLAVENIASSRVLFPRGMDANEYAKKVQPASQSLGVLLRSAEPMAGAAVRHAASASATPPAAATAPAIVEPPHPPKDALEEAASSLAAAAVEPPSDSDERAAPPPAPPRLADVAAEVRSDDETVITLGDRSYRVRGLAKNTVSPRPAPVACAAALGGDCPDQRCCPPPA
jgi:DNA primase catalytic core